MLALVREPVGNDMPSGRVTARQRDPVAPSRINDVELGQVAEAPGRPEPRLVVSDGPSTDPFSRAVSGVQAVA